jgi:ABC-2 type transport system permease protein
LVWILQGCFIYGSIHFALAALTGRTLPSYGLAVLSMAVFTLFFVAFIGVSGTRLFWLEVLDPMGHHTLTGQLSLWSVQERSHRFLQATPGLLLNRVLYIGGALSMLLFARWRFSLAALVARTKSPSRASRTQNGTPGDIEQQVGAKGFAPTITNYGARFRSVRVAWYLALRELQIAWSGTAFRIVIAAVVLLGFLGARFGSVDYYTQPEQHILPAAQYLLELVGKQMFMMLVMAGVYFGTEMLARDRTARMSMLVDTAPVTTNALAGAKWLAITLFSLTLAPLPALTVFLFQILSGYHELVPVHFLRSFLQTAPQVIVYCWIAMAIYSLTRSKIAGQSISILLLFFIAIMHSINAIEQHFFVLGLPTDLVFSDFQVMGASNARHLSFDAWYFGIAGGLVVFAAWLWPRGTDTSLAKRAAGIPRSISWSTAVMLCLAVGTLGLGGMTAWRSLHVDHLYRSMKERRNDAASYEKQYSADDSWPQPLIQSMAVHLKMDPGAKRMEYEGVWRLKNANKQPLTQLHVEMPESALVPQLVAQGSPLVLEHWDESHRVGIWRLSNALLPGQTLDLEIKSGVQFHSFEEKPFEGTIGADTAWFDASYLPHFGYDRTREIDSPVYRTEYGLSVRKERAVREDALAASGDARWVNLDLYLSIPSEWTATANGQQIDQVTEGKRKTIHFQANDVPLNMQVVAGNLASHTETLTSLDGRKIPATLYYRPGHSENVARMSRILGETFAEWERRFGPCPTSYISLAEIPQYQTDGEPEKPTPVSATQGLIVMPERLGWIHNYRAEPARDWLSFVLSEELSRAWWGNRVAAREGPGSALVDDGVPILLGLNMIEKLHGVKAADDYAGMLQDRLRKEMALESGPAPTVLTTNFEEYSDNQAALALYDQRRKLGRERFDNLLDQRWKELSAASGGQVPVSPASIAERLGLVEPPIPGK